MNVVVMVGGNDDEVLDFADYARRTGRTGSVIEYMPLDAAHAWERPLVLAGEEIVRRIVARWPLVAIPPPDTPLLRSGSASSTAAATSG